MTTPTGATPTGATTTEKRGGLADLRKMFGNGQSTLRQFGILGSLVVIIALFQLLTWLIKGRVSRSPRRT